MSSQYYIAGSDARWKGVVEVRDDDTWYWHKDWPARSRNTRHLRDCTGDHVKSGYWAPMLDEDLQMDEGL